MDWVKNGRVKNGRVKNGPVKNGLGQKWPYTNFFHWDDILDFLMHIEGFSSTEPNI